MCAGWGGEADGRCPGNVVAAAVDAAAGVYGDVYVAAGYHGGERGAAVDSAGSAGEPAGPAVGDRRLRAGAGGAVAAGGHSRRPAGPTAAVPGRPGHLHGRVAGVCAGPDRAGAGVVPRV